MLTLKTVAYESGCYIFTFQTVVSEILFLCVLHPCSYLVWPVFLLFLLLFFSLSRLHTQYGAHHRAQTHDNEIKT